MALHLSVLNWLIFVEGVQLDGLVGSSTILVLGGVTTNPEVKIVFELITFRIFIGVEDDVGITAVEFTILVLIPVSDLNRN